jgi:hypothetical protein
MAGAIESAASFADFFHGKPFNVLEISSIRLENGKPGKWITKSPGFQFCGLLTLQLYSQ